MTTEEKRQEKAVNLIGKFEDEELIWALNYIWSRIVGLSDEEFKALGFDVPKQIVNDCLYILIKALGRKDIEEEPTFEVGNEVLNSDEVEIQIVKKKSWKEKEKIETEKE